MVPFSVDVPTPDSRAQDPADLLLDWSIVPDTWRPGTHRYPASATSGLPEMLSQPLPIRNIFVPHFGQTP